MTEIDFSAIQAAVLDMISPDLGDIVRVEARRIVLTILTFAIPASSGAADQLEYYGGAA